MMTLVATRATACASGGIRIRNGGEWMNCSQNSTPAMKKLECISQMCTAWLFSARSNGRRDVPEQHHDVEQHHGDPRPQQPAADRAQRP